MHRLAWLSLILAGAAAAQNKPAAVQLCFTLPDGVALFATKAQPDYRALGDGVFVLDFDVRLGGRAPERLTKTSATCLRAWLPARPVKRIDVDFSRTDLNLRPTGKDVDLKLKPDLWYDGGGVTVERAPFSSIASSLPGRLTVERMRGDVAEPQPETSALPRGQYRVGYEAPTHVCDITVSGVATGTVREDNHPKLVAELVDAYRREWAQDVAKDLRLQCAPGEALQLQVRIVDGAYFRPREPLVRKVKVPGREPHYTLSVNGEAKPFQPGSVVDVDFEQHLVLESTEPKEVASGS